MNKPKIYQVATAHLDTVWNWTLELTVKQYLVNTFRDNFALMDKYPCYTFNFEGSYRYALIKEFYPEGYEELKARVEAGRWFLTGSSWENGDVVTPEPETLMRNILYGNRWFEADFGKKSNDIFLPDCFGFPSTLPTVMVHMGLKAFSSQKLSWNPQGSTAPFHVGRWQGIDGSEVIASIDPGPYGSRVTESPARNRGLHDMVAGLPLARDVRYYGTGDCGGAPTEESARLVHEAVSDKDGDNEVIAAYAGQLADELTPEEWAQLPVYRGDLLMVTHGVGSYSSVAPTKRFHRSCEMKADVAEKLNVLASHIGAKTYPAATLRRAWRDFIRHEFHDDLTGTSVARAYRETFHDDIVANKTFDGEIEAAFVALVDNVNTASVGCSGKAIVIFNPCAWDRREAVEVLLPASLLSEGGLTLFDGDGKVVPAQILGRNDGKVRVLFTADLPSVGYATYRVLPKAAGTADAFDTGLSVDENGLENSRWRVRLDADGNVASMWDKQNGRELLAAPIHFEFLKNNFRAYGSWEIGYEDEIAAPMDVLGGPAKVEIIEKGDVRVALKVTRAYHTSEITQILSLDAAGGDLRFDNDVTWSEGATLLKCAFPFALESDIARYDTGLGSIERPDRNPALYEVPVHKWANFYDPAQDYGATVVNDCKYGMDKAGNVLRLTCIHTPANAFSPASRQDLQDFGQNLFSFSVGGGKGDFRKTQAERAGILFNQKPVACLTDVHEGKLPAAYSFLRLSGNLSLKAVKKAEDSDEIIVRVAESFGEAGIGTLTVTPGILSAREVNGYEEPVAADNGCLKDGHLTFPIGAFTPKTFALTLGPACNIATGCEVAGGVADAAVVRYETLPLDGTVPFTSDNLHRGEYGFGEEKTTVPYELLRERIESEGDGKRLVVADVPFAFCERDGNFCAACPDQADLTWKIPSGARRVVLMATSLGEDATLRLTADGKEITVPVPACTDDVGGWDQYALKWYGFILESRVAFVPSHTHDTEGDRVYGRMNFYFCPVDLPEGIRTLTVPACGTILIAAATAVIPAHLTAFASDIALHKAPRASHTLTVVGENCFGGGIYYGGNPVYVAYAATSADLPDGDVIWHFSDGSTRTGHAISFAMPEKDLTVTCELVRPFASRIIPDDRIWSSTAFDTDIAAHVCDGSAATLWRSETEGVNSLVFDLKRRQPVSRATFLHAGFFAGDQTLNTYEYDLDALVGGEWITVSSTRGNLMPVSENVFDEVVTRYLRLRVLRGSRNGNDKRAAIVSASFYSDRVAKETWPDEEIGAFDLPERNEDDDVLFDGNVVSGAEIAFDRNTYAKAYWAEGTSVTLSFYDADGNLVATETGRAVTAPGKITRLLFNRSVRKIVVDKTVDASGKEDASIPLFLKGKSGDLALLKSFRGTDCQGSRNPKHVRREDGSVLLPAGEGEGHDVWGYKCDVPLGYFTLGIKVRVAPDEICSVPDDFVLFAYDALNVRGNMMGHFFTVGDYKTAPADENGYRTLMDSFFNRESGEVEGRIWSHRNITMAVRSFDYYLGKL